MTSKERAALRAQANTIETTLIVGKGGVSEQVLQEASNLLDAHELIKGKVLETAMLTAREASDAAFATYENSRYAATNPRSAHFMGGCGEGKREEG